MPWIASGGFGHPNPPDAIQGITKKITRHVHKTPWVAEHWR
jgi:hypothetical protein